MNIMKQVVMMRAATPIHLPWSIEDWPYADDTELSVRICIGFCNGLLSRVARVSASCWEKPLPPPPEISALPPYCLACSRGAE